MSRRAMVVVVILVLVVAAVVLTLFTRNRELPTSPDGQVVLEGGINDGAVPEAAPGQ